MAALPFKVKAVYEYSSPHGEDLSFPSGQILTVTEEEDDDWYYGKYTDSAGTNKEGLFPRNFVEKFEPETPPRPVRDSRLKKEAEVLAQPEKLEERDDTEDIPNDAKVEPAPTSTKSIKAANVALPISSTSKRPVSSGQPEPPPSPASSVPKLGPKSATIVAVKPTPPIAEKPSGNSFRDRIAAFNKPAAPPIAPFKPGGAGSAGGTGFIKKPFVAPPPSKDAYVPIPREQPPQKVYRREEDPELAASAVNDTTSVERGIAPAPIPGVLDEGDQAKPTSLKERIALLQKQQLEQAARHAEAAQKKDKPKRPQKRRAESHEAGAAPEYVEGASLEKLDSTETLGKHPSNAPQEETEEPFKPTPVRRKSSKEITQRAASIRESQSDANDADQSAAGDTTEDPEESTGRDDSDTKPTVRVPPPPARAPTVQREPVAGQGDDEEEELDDEEDEEEDIDPEVKRRMEIRERMAKMSGGMGMMGMFGPPGGMPPGAVKNKKPSGTRKEDIEQNEEPHSPAAHAPPFPIMPIGGVIPTMNPEAVDRQLVAPTEPGNAATYSDEEASTVGESRTSDRSNGREIYKVSHEPSAPQTYSIADPEPPVSMHQRSPPPLPSHETRPLPPPPPPTNIVASPSPGSESDDEMPEHAETPGLSTTSNEGNQHPPPPISASSAPSIPNRPVPASAQKRADQRAPDASARGSTPTSPTNKRMSQAPPIPGSSPMIPVSTQSRPPPPPPPTAAPPSRQSTGDGRAMISSKHAVQDEEDEEVTEYEGDYDTDIAPGATHKDALKSHARDSSIDDVTGDEMSARSTPTSATTMPPSVPRGGPPPPPHQPPKISRNSMDSPRAPPPIPPSREAVAEEGEEYDPFKYTVPRHGVTVEPVTRSPLGTYEQEEEENDLYATSPQHRRPPSLPPQQPPHQHQERPVPQPLSITSPLPLMATRQPSTRGQGRTSLDVQSASYTRRSIDQNRGSTDHESIAQEVDLGQGSQWWAQANMPPPIFQNRKDLIFEIEESTSAKRGGKATTLKDVYILFQDYSQTVVSVQFDPQDVADAILTQRHEPPPARPRQDQLEDAHSKFGQQISNAVTGKQNTVVGDGEPLTLVHELLKPLSGALPPVGTRAFGAVVYSNLANASIQLNDEIRAGDIITMRNAKLQGHRGPMHAKYAVDIGKPDHVAIVVDWDGTKKKVRAWEQGRENKKVKMESFKLSDLRSGEVKIWRVMPREWVGWTAQTE